MGREYAMFVNENGFINNNKGMDFCMIGIVFDNDYCADLEDEKSELNRILSEYGNTKKNIREYIMGLPLLIKKLNFKIIISTIKNIGVKGKSIYEMVVNDLINQFNKYINRNNGKYGSIIVEDKKSLESAKVIQSFFDVYNKREESAEQLVNSFKVYDSKNSNYSGGFKLSGIINEVYSLIYTGSKIKKTAITYNIDTSIKEHLLEELEDKNVNELIINDDYNNSSEGINYNAQKLDNEVYKLQKEIEYKRSKLIKSEMIMNKLKNEIEVLKQQLKVYLEVKEVNNY